MILVMQSLTFSPHARVSAVRRSCGTSSRRLMCGDFALILDFAPNHVSKNHPYYADAAENGGRSAYFDFFARTAAGQVAHYFDWEHLKNLNYDNPEAQRLIIEAFAYWVREFDVDGFR